MPKLKELIDERGERAAVFLALIGAGWMAAIVWLAAQGKMEALSPWPGVALLIGAAIVYVGKKAFEGVTISPTEGIKIEGDEDGRE